MLSANAWLLVVIALVVVVLIVGGAVAAWWIHAARARRAHEEGLRAGVEPNLGASLGVPSPFELPFGANDTVPVVPLNEIDDEYERLAAEPVTGPTQTPFGQATPTSSFSWDAAVRDPDPSLPANVYRPPQEPALPVAPPEQAAPVSPAPAPPAPAVPPTPPVLASPVAPPLPAARRSIADPQTQVRPAVPPTEPTVVVRREPDTGWELVLPDGEALALAPDTVVGRRPEHPEGTFGLTIHDETRTLSKTHARLRFTGQAWTVEDLGSTNGVMLVHEDGREEEVVPRQPALATRRLLLGTLAVEIRSTTARLTPGDTR